LKVQISKYWHQAGIQGCYQIALEEDSFPKMIEQESDEPSLNIIQIFHDWFVTHEP